MKGGFMERLTVKNNKTYELAGGADEKKAVERLGRYEDMYAAKSWKGSRRRIRRKPWLFASF